MRVPRTTLLPICMCGLLAAVLICGLPVRPQITKGCAGINYASADSSNPFTAEYVTTSTVPAAAGAPKISVTREDVARDSEGCIRIERHGVTQPPDDRKTVTLETPEGQPFTVTREEYGTSIQIFDCASGTLVLIQPGMRMATVKTAKNAAPANRVKHAYSTPYIFGAGVKIPPTTIVEQLGTKEIQGITSIGMKTTTLGTEKDGDWNAKPIHEYEIWVSDELAATMMRIDKDLRAGSEGRFELMNIKRENPDPILFEIPKGYETNPTRLPISRNLGVVRPSKE